MVSREIDDSQKPNQKTSLPIYIYIYIVRLCIALKQLQKALISSLPLVETPWYRHVIA
jgi:hypothetical protein